MFIGVFVNVEGEVRVHADGEILGCFEWGADWLWFFIWMGLEVLLLRETE